MTCQSVELDTSQGADSEAGRQAFSDYRRRTLLRLGILLLLGLVVVAAFVVSMMVGPIKLSPGEVLSGLIDSHADAQTATVVRDLRLPPALLAVLVGAALSLAGVQMQTILDNPLAEPFTLGISAAAALGASIVIVSGLALPLAPSFTIPAAAMAAGLAAAMAIAAVARLPQVTKETMVLLGIALVFTFNAAPTLMQLLASGQARGRG